MRSPCECFGAIHAAHSVVASASARSEVANDFQTDANVLLFHAAAVAGEAEMASSVLATVGELAAVAGPALRPHMAGMAAV